jgi:hypothetical protein
MLGVTAGRLDAWVIAEGVEREPELLRLMQISVPLAQGYGLARPAVSMEKLMPATAELLAKVRVQSDGDGIGALVEPCEAIDEGASRARLADLFVQDPRNTLIGLLGVVRVERLVEALAR